MRSIKQDDDITTPELLTQEACACADLAAELRDLVQLVGPDLRPRVHRELAEKMAHARRVLGELADFVCGLDPEVLQTIAF